MGSKHHTRVPLTYTFQCCQSAYSPDSSLSSIYKYRKHSSGSRTICSELTAIWAYKRLPRTKITMPAYHPETGDANRHLAGMPILPLRQTSKVSVRAVAPETTGEDIVDEILGLFKANIFFKNYNINTGE